MGIKQCWLLTAAIVCVAPLGAGSAAGADDDDAVRASRWKDLQQALFPGRHLQEAQGGGHELQATRALKHNIFGQLLCKNIANQEEKKGACHNHYATR